MKTNKILKVFFAIIIASYVLIPILSLADLSDGKLGKGLTDKNGNVEPVTLTVPIPQDCSKGGKCTKEEIGGLLDIVETVYRAAFGIGAFLAVVMIVYGGVQYTLSEVITKKQDAVDIIKNAIYGLLLLFLSVTILKFINPDLTIIKEPSIQGIGKVTGDPVGDQIKRENELCNSGVVDPSEGGCTPKNTHNSTMCQNYLQTTASEGDAFCNERCHCFLQDASGKIITSEPKVTSVCGKPQAQCHPGDILISKDPTDDKCKKGMIQAVDRKKCNNLCLFEIDKQDIGYCPE